LVFICTTVIVKIKVAAFFWSQCVYFFHIQALAALDEFQNLDRDIEGSAKRWKKFVEHETPEKEKFPQEWKNKSALQKLCMMRALRPDRMTYAVKWVQLTRLLACNIVIV